MTDRYALDLSTPYGKMVCAELIYLSETKQVSLFAFAPKVCCTFAGCENMLCT